MILLGTRPAASGGRLRQLVLEAAASPQTWLHLVRYDPARRWYQRLLAEEDRELWLLTWLPGQRTGFHDHGRSAGAFTVVQGCLRERTAPRGRPEPAGAALPEGSARSFGPWYIHDVTNASARPAISIHAYSPPLTTMQRFDVSAGRLVPAAAETAGQW
ncbi:MAG TPA: cysteine dioxygenase family protein [Streptosporangiaceae bacterium]|nr:cysteine dioxygenase family protein [Streptosporangiaceae bacterium]